MYHPIQLASFALMHLEYFLEGLTDEDARRRMPKEDGSEMNSISWIVSHISWQWILRATAASTATDAYLEQLLSDMSRFSNGTDDPTPPSLQDALSYLHEATLATRNWVSAADRATLDREGREGYRHPTGQNQGSLLIRGVLHTWCHGGEINAIRQMMGHPEIPFVMFMAGNMDWRPEGSSAPDWVTFPPIVQPLPQRG